MPTGLQIPWHEAKVNTSFGVSILVYAEFCYFKEITPLSLISEF